MTSLRRRLIVGTVAATVLIYLVAAAVLYVSIRRSLLAEFDAALDAQGRALVAQTEQGEKGIKLDLEPGQLAAGSNSQTEGFVLLHGNGSVIARSEGPARGLWWSNPPGVGADETFAWGVLPSGHRIRSVSLRFVPRPEDDEHPVTQREPLMLIVTRDLSTLLGRLTQLAWLLASVFGLTVLASAGIMAWVVRRGLRPLGTLAQRISQLDQDDLATKVDLIDSPRELQPVVDRLNDLLQRLYASFSRERAFTADVAHELRNPLAGLTTALEVAAGRRRSPEEYEKTIAKCLKVSQSMRSMVENLLTLARADAHQLQPTLAAVEMGSIGRDAWRSCEPTAKARQLHMTWSCDDNLLVRADPGLLKMVLNNLFDNAASYTNRGGAMWVEGRNAPDSVVFSVRNTGSQVTAQDTPYVFERFWRGDVARSQAGQHCGLGLALCRRLVTLLGGTITAQSTLDGEFHITLTLAAAPISNALGV